MKFMNFSFSLRFLFLFAALLVGGAKVASATSLTTYISTVSSGEQGHYDCNTWWEWVWIDEDHGYWQENEDCDWVHEYYWYIDAIQIYSTSSGCPIQLTVTLSDSSQLHYNLTGNGGTVTQQVYFTSNDAYPVSASANQSCAYVTAITGLPFAVCPNTNYTVTAVSSDGNTLPSLQWGGNATLVSQSGNNATVYFATPGSNLIVWAQANNQPSPPQAQAATDVIDTEILQDSSVLSSGDIVHIDATPTMPALKARLKNSTGLTGTVDWKLNIVFNRTNRDDSNDLTGNGTAATATWTVPWGTSFYGGTATLTGTYKKGGNSMAICATQVVHIRGTNPTNSTLETFIGTSPWYAVPIARWEHTTDGLQFNNVGTEGPNFLTQIKNTPNRASDTFGWGVFQLTNPAATVTQVWNWKANITEAMSRINGGHRTDAVNWISSQETQQLAEKPSQILDNEVFTWGGVNFQKGTSKTATDACAIQRYNGVAGGWVVYWDNASQTWKTHSSSYVAGVAASI